MITVLTTASGAPEREVHSDLRLAGLTLLQRAVLTLQKAGASKILLATTKVGALDQALEALRGDPRVTVELEARVGSASDDLSWLSPDGPILIARHHLVGDAGLYRHLIEGGAGAAVVVHDGAAVGIARVTGDALEASGGRLDPAAWLDGGAERVELGALPSACNWLADVRDEAGQRRAKHELFEACRKSVDGVVSRHFNRHVSLFISKRLVDLPVSPNAMTGVTFLFAIAAAAFAVRGGYGPTLVAAALMQTNSILDGVDGELARVRFEGSRLGQWLDTIGDDASNVLFWAALGFGARHIPGYGEWLAWAGWLTAAANGLAALQYYRQLVLVGSGDLYALQDDTAASSNALVTVIGYLLKQDFFLMLTLVLALAGVLHWALPVTALGALVTLGNATVRGIALRRRSDAR